MLYLDNNAELRDLFREVDGVSQHGLDELFDQDVIEGKRSFADAIIQAGIVGREDLFELISQYLGYELQVGEGGRNRSGCIIGNSCRNCPAVWGGPTLSIGWRDSLACP